MFHFELLFTKNVYYRYFKVYISKIIEKCLPFIKMTWEFFIFSIGLNKQTELNFPRLFFVLLSNRRGWVVSRWINEYNQRPINSYSISLSDFRGGVCAVCICDSFIVSIVMFFSQFSSSRMILKSFRFDKFSKIVERVFILCPLHFNVSFSF